MTQKLTLCISNQVIQTLVAHGTSPIGFDASCNAVITKNVTLLVIDTALRSEISVPSQKCVSAVCNEWLLQNFKADRTEMLMRIKC